MMLLRSINKYHSLLREKGNHYVHSNYNASIIKNMKKNETNKFLTNRGKNYCKVR